MKATTISIIKADIGSIGVHVAPSKVLLDTVNGKIGEGLERLIDDYFIGATGDDIAILMVHNKGVGDEEIHRFAWNAFRAGNDTAKAQGLYGAGQDLLVDSFSGNVKGKGMGPQIRAIASQCEEFADSGFRIRRTLGPRTCPDWGLRSRKCKFADSCHLNLVGPQRVDP